MGNAYVDKTKPLDEGYSPNYISEYSLFCKRLLTNTLLVLGRQGNRKAALIIMLEYEKKISYNH